MIEKRKSRRLSIDIPVKCKILNRRKKNEISHEILSRINNLSENGACLIWSKAWACKVCINCLAWIFNHACILKEENYPEESNKCLTNSTFIRIELEPPAAPEPIKIIAKIIWVRQDSQKDSYKIGCSFLKDRENKNRLLKDFLCYINEQKIP